MSTTLPSTRIPADAAVQQTRAFLDRLFPPPRDFAVRLWDGTVIGGEQGTQYTLVLNSPGAARRMFSFPIEIALGEAYFRGDFDLEGDFYAAFGLARRLTSDPPSRGDLLALARLRRGLPKDDAPSAAEGHDPARLSGSIHSKSRDRAAIKYHYDVSNEFYELWLDRNMLYTTAYFPTGAEDLETAQELKLEHICRKLRLQPGERLLDVGCGWGGLLIYAAKNFGVRALGITLSEEQRSYALRRIAEEGLSDRLSVQLVDYRDLNGEEFDKISSVGMFEHVGRSHSQYFPKIYELLRPGGLFLNHCIAVHPSAPWWGHAAWQRAVRRFMVGNFRDRHIFPDVQLVVLSEANLMAEKSGFEVRDVESLREHYPLTLREWVTRLERHKEEAIRLVGEATFRAWKLYMASPVMNFEAGYINVNQTLFAKPVKGHMSVPFSRADLYA